MNEEETVPAANEDVGIKLGTTNDGRVCVIFSRPVPDLLFAPQKAREFAEHIRQLSRDAENAGKKRRKSPAQ